MDFEKPDQNMYTIYSKSGCTFCVKVKKLLLEKKISFDMIDCDEYLLENKEEFLNYIKEIAGREYKTFPMVFLRGKFIGGYNETKQLLDKEEAFDSF